MAAVKALQQWCRIQCEGYLDVNITNMTTSFRDGLAFCALIHKHRPDLINFNSLKKENVYDNNKLAFSVAEEQLGIPALLDAEDMVALKVPDRLSILTYVSQYYNYFHGRSPIGGLGGIKRPAEAPSGEPAGKKNQPVMSKVFPSSKPARENSPPPSSNITRPAPSPKQTRNAKQDAPVEKPHQTGTLSNKCVSCSKHVHLVQRHLVEGKLYHRHCAKALLPANPLTTLRDLPTNTEVSKSTPQADISKTGITTHTPSRPGPAWLLEKPSNPPIFSSPVSTTSPSKTSSDQPSAGQAAHTSSLVPKPAPRQTNYEPKATPMDTTPTPAPRTSAAATKTLQSKLKFFQSDNTAKDTEKETTTSNTDVKKDTKVTEKASTTKDTEKKPQSMIFDSKKDKEAEKPNAVYDKDKKAAAINSELKKDTEVAEKDKTTKDKEKKASIFSFGLKKDTKGTEKANTADDKEKKTKASNTEMKNDTKVVEKTNAINEKDKKTTAIDVNLKKNPKVGEKTDTTPNKEKKTPAMDINVKKDTKVTEKTHILSDKERTNPTINVHLKTDNKVKEASPGQAVTVVVNVGGPGSRGTDVRLDTEKAETSTGGDSGNVSESSKMKASAAAFISKKLTEENSNNNSTPSWTNVVLKKTEKPSPVDTPKKETEKVRGRVRLKADPSILADLNIQDTTPLAPTSTNKTELKARSPDRGKSKYTSVSPHRSAASENESPTDWRSMLKPVSKETKPAGPQQTSPKPWANGAGKTQTSEFPSPPAHTSIISVTPPASKGFLNGQRDQTTNGAQSETKIVKTKPDYIPKDKILKELQDIEDDLNKLEKRGVELEVKLRSSEEDGEDDSLLDELMVEWFNLIRNKQVAIRRESELVYIGRTQDLEEQQPSVEQELRRLMETPDYRKTEWDRRREKELMDKLVEIVNDRNAIIDGLDEDRIREEEEDEELNKMMRNFSFKKEKPKKKSQMSKLFSWGSKKEG